MIRIAKVEDMPQLLRIYEAARAFMRANGNLVQWAGSYPGADVLAEDIACGRLFVVDENGHLGGCFMLAAGPDDTYAKIYDGAWGYDKPYGVIHRIASDGTFKGVLAQAVTFGAARFDHLRIDTHEKNLPMQKALAKQGFTYRGVIYIHDGTPRMAYDKVFAQ